MLTHSSSVLHRLRINKHTSFQKSHFRIKFCIKKNQPILFISLSQNFTLCIHEKIKSNLTFLLVF